MSSVEAVRIDRDLNSPTLDMQSALAGELKLPGDLAQLRERYKNAKPFPHLVLDDLFPNEVLEAITADQPELNRENWIYFDKEGLQKVLRMRSSVNVGAATFQLTAFLHSPAFLYLLSELTGVWQLLPDPYLQGAGHAVMRRGMYFKVHTDRSVAYETGLTRRLAMIIFLNKDWKSEYAGELELWNHEGTRCEVSIPPLFNRTVLFEVANPNFHGVPAALNCPPDRARQSFIAYFHTVGIDGKEVPPHSSIFAPEAYKNKKMTLRQVVEESTPPVLFRALRRLLGRDI